MAFIKCPKCGCQIDENVAECPSCGCPFYTTSMEEELLNECKSTETESSIKIFADSILKWGNILAIVILCVQLFGCFVIFILDPNMAFNILICIFGGLLALLEYFITKFIVKTIWSSIMLSLNISTTLKRIEIKLEKQGTY